MTSIQPIVEGHGDVAAVPVLLRRLIEEAQAYRLSVGKPIRQPRGKLVKQDSLRTAVKLALRQRDCGSILVLFDGDDDCPRNLAPTLRTWAREEAGPIPCEVVIAKHEYEAWFLAALDSLGLAGGTSPPRDPEAVRGAKEKLESFMPQESYVEKVDQPRFTAHLDMAAACRCRSFRQMVTAFGRLAEGMGYRIASWPPPSWRA